MADLVGKRSSKLWEYHLGECRESPVALAWFEGDIVSETPGQGPEAQDSVLIRWDDGSFDAVTVSAACDETTVASSGGQRIRVVC